MLPDKVAWLKCECGHRWRLDLNIHEHVVDIAKHGKKGVLYIRNNRSSKIICPNCGRSETVSLVGYAKPGSILFLQLEYWEEVDSDEN